MTQVSRPFQLLLAVFAVFVVVWFAALRNHAVGTGSSSSSSPPVAQPTRKPVKAHTATTHKVVVRTTTVVHRSQARAHTSAVTVKVGPAAKNKPTPAPAKATPAPAPTKAVPAKATPTPASTKLAPAKATPTPDSTKLAPAKTAPTPAPTKPAPAKSLSAEAQVESQLKAGKTVLILFWNPHGAEDVAVRGELPAVQRRLGGKIAVRYAAASQVGEYGAVTHAVQVNQTPTLVIVNPHGQATVITGLTDAFAIEQAVREANHQ